MPSGLNVGFRTHLLDGADILSHHAPTKKVQCRKEMVACIRRWRESYLPAPKATAAGARKELRDIKKSAAKIAGWVLALFIGASGVVETDRPPGDVSPGECCSVKRKAL